MGTQLSIELNGATRQALLTAGERAVRAFGDAEVLLSTWSDTSELARFNRAAVGESVAISPALYDALAAALQCARDTDGAFDPSVGALVDAWGLRAGGRLPSDDELTAARERSGHDALILGKSTATRTRDVRIEEGGFGKGVGLDRAMAALGESAILQAYLSIGGQVALRGEGRWIPVAHPENRAEVLVEVFLENGSLATTGNSERGIVVGGRRMSHSIDPRTGMPAGDFGSVSVWSESAARADCLSTALFVMGPARALRWVARHEDVEAIVAVKEVDGVTLYASDGMALRCPENAPACKNAVARGRGKEP